MREFRDGIIFKALVFKKFFSKTHIPLIVFCVAASAPFLYKFLKKPDKKVFLTTKPTTKTISRVVDSSGTLEIKDNLKIGSLIAGVVRKVLVEENEKVHQGQVLAIIDNGKEDCEVLLLRAEADQVRGKMIYQKNHFKRVKELHMEGFVSQDDFELERSKLVELEGRLHAAKARLKKAKIEFENTRIKAPKDGTVTAVRVTEGEAVTASLDATVLFELASDISAMQAVFQIEESDIAWIKKGQDLTLSFEGGYEQEIAGSVGKIGFTPRTKSGVTYFKVFVDVSDPDKKLRSGITVNASIITDKQADALSVPGQVFYMSDEAVGALGKALEYQVRPVSKKKAVTSGNKYLWTVSGRSFVQKEVSVGINDNVSFHVMSGVNPGDEVVIDIDEKNINEDTFKRAFKRF